MECLHQFGQPQISTVCFYPINPKAKDICGVKAYPRISAVPAPVDVAIILVSAGMTPDVVEECCKCGVRFIVVESAGFAELGAEGKR